MSEQTEKLPEKDQIELYAVRNSKGQWFHAKGQSGYGDSWVDTLKTARIYSRIGPARSTVTYFSSNPKYPPPVIVKFVVKELVVLDEVERRNKIKAAKLKAALLQKQREKQEELERAKRALQRAQADLEKLTGTKS